MDDTFEKTPHMMLNQVPLSAWCKDANLNYVFMNERCLQLLQIKSNEVLGFDDYEMPWDIYADDFRNADKRVIKEAPLAILHPVLLKNGEELTIVSRKSAIKNPQGLVTGVLGLVTIVANKKIIESSRTLSLVDSELIGSHISRNQYFLDGNDKFNLSPKEKECLFYLIRGKSSKEISLILSCSIRTIEHRMENLKVKFSCNKKSELISKAIENGYVHIVPSHLLTNLKEVFT